MKDRKNGIEKRTVHFITNRTPLKKKSFSIFAFMRKVAVRLGLLQDREVFGLGNTPSSSKPDQGGLITGKCDVTLMESDRRLTEIQHILLRYPLLAKLLCLGERVFANCKFTDIQEFSTEISSRAALLQGQAKNLTLKSVVGQDGQSEDKKRALLWLHGFNSDVPDALLRGAATGIELEDVGVAVVPMLLPSQGNSSPIAYIEDESNYEASVPAALHSLNILESAMSGASNVDVCCHSMGSLPMTGLLVRRYDQAGGNPEKLNSAIFLSPDIASSRILSCAVEVVANVRAGRLFVLQSSHDIPLQLSEWLRRADPDVEELRWGDARNQPEIPGVTYVIDSHNDFGLLGHAQRTKTIKAILADPNFSDRTIWECARTGVSPVYRLIQAL